VRGDKDVIKTEATRLFMTANPSLSFSRARTVSRLKTLYNVYYIPHVQRRREASTQEHQKGQILAIKLNERLLLIHRRCKVRRSTARHARSYRKTASPPLFSAAV
jgi:hypothetical protein